MTKATLPLARGRDFNAVELSNNDKTRRAATLCRQGMRQVRFRHFNSCRSPDEALRAQSGFSVASPRIAPQGGSIRATCYLLTGGHAVHSVFPLELPFDHLGFIGGSRVALLQSQTVFHQPCRDQATGKRDQAQQPGHIRKKTRQ